MDLSTIFDSDNEKSSSETHGIEMKDRFTLTDIARYMNVSRPSAYKVVRSFGFPPRGQDRRWSSIEVRDWIADNDVTGAVVVAGVLVR